MELHKLVVSSSNSKSKASTLAGEVFEELKKIKKRGARIYRTYPMDDRLGKRHFILSTTSKDVHLFFGVSGFDGQFLLSRMLEEEFRLEKCSQLLLCLQLDTLSNEHAILVTYTVEQAPDDWKIITFTFSPAH